MSAARKPERSRKTRRSKTAEPDVDTELLSHLDRQRQILRAECVRVLEDRPQRVIGRERRGGVTHHDRRRSAGERVAEVQRDLYVDLVRNSVQASTRLLELTGQIVQDSVRPLQQRVHART